MQLLMLVPIGKVAGALLLTEATPQLSAVVGEASTTVAKQSSASVVVFTSAAQMIVGLVVS